MFATNRVDRANKRNVFIIILVILCLVLLFKRNYYCFGMREQNVETYKRIARALNDEGVTWYLSYGSLLGAIRENNLLVQEYDIDIAVESCSDLDKIRDVFPKYNLQYFNQSDRVEAKRKLTYDTVEKQIKMASPFLHAPCGRLYSSDGSGYFADIYGFITLKPEEFSKYPDLLLPKIPDPESPDVQRDLVCCNHGLYKAEWEAGGCHHKANIYPLQKGEFLGQVAYYPHKPENVLREHYGEGWRIPVKKGLRWLIC
eukprot:TRINITY_DN14000_c0_g1_i1.p1 TRINITY_DN14000_c0_g1~~TRINITY_DN14000_c0_g1_i1.p1  ORF type:complete len:272 (+),score=32.64 TRINITY_DN14000_c0_g1_i1:47-817(+)